MEALAKLVKKDGCKYFQTLNGHTEDSLKILKCYMDNNKEIIQHFCKRWDLSSVLFLKNLFITVYLHDIGKLTDQFQTRIQKGLPSPEYPHAFFSVPIIFNLYKQGVISPLLPSKEFPLIELCSILGHHTQLYDLIYNDINTNPRFLEKQIKEFINEIPKIYRKLEFGKYFDFEWKEVEPDFDLPGNGELFDNIKKFRNILNGRARENKERVRLKSVYCFFHSILQLCDDYSSANFHEYIQNYNGDKKYFDSILEDADEFVSVLPDAKKEDILKDPETDEIFTPHTYQDEILENPPKFCLLFAPCGRGKTEAALVWAFEVCKRCKRNKIIFAMPTQITSNAMWERFCKLFGEGKTKEEKIRSGMKYVGLYHGKSFLAHREKRKEEKGADEDDLTEEDLEEVKEENFKGNVFFKPITITTIDHLILSFVHGFNQADFTLGNLQNAVIIFDEVHYYEKSTLEHLMTLFEILKEMSIPNLLMSGTLPDFFVKEVKKINPEYFGPIEDKEGLNFKPFSIEVKDSLLISKEGINGTFLDEVVENYKAGLNQFVILNTVKRSQEVYEKIKKALIEKSINPNISLLHSEFIWEDRRNKEKLLIRKLKVEKERPLIFVSTQVMELSLDISCDRMYTELAPADALGQRGGRLNRGVAKPNGAVMKVFMPEEFFMEEGRRKRPYDFELLEKTVKFLEEREYNYKDIKNACDEVYDSIELENRRLRKVFELCSIFGRKPVYRDESAESTFLQIREDTFQKMDVIPMDITEEKIKDFCKHENIDVAFLSQRLPIINSIQYIMDELSERQGCKEMPLLFLKDEIKLKRSHGVLDEKLIRKFNTLVKKVCSVKSEGKVPLYLYHQNIENIGRGNTDVKLFDFVKIKNRWFRFTWIPYSNEVGFQYDKIVNIKPRIEDFMI